MNAAYIPFCATGHILAALPMLKELCSHNVHLTCFGPESFREHIENTGAVFSGIPMDNARSSGVSGDGDFMAALPLVFLSEARRIIDSILHVLKSAPPDVIICDELAIAGRLAASALNIPLIMVFTSFAPSKNFSICRTWPIISDSHPLRKAAKHLAYDLSDQYGVPHLDIYEIFEGTGMLNISMLSREFQPDSDSFGNDFIFTGAQISSRVGDSNWKPDRNDLPLIYSSLGSLFNNWPQFYPMLFDAVKDLPVQVLCATGKYIRSSDIGPIPSNVSITAFAPQLEVLRHASVFITHAGTGSAMEAMYFGVPCLCIPQMPEQEMSALQLERLGISGPFLKKGQISSVLLKEQLIRLLYISSYKENALYHSRIMSKQNNSLVAAEAIVRFLNEYQRRKQHSASRPCIDHAGFERLHPAFS